MATIPVEPPSVWLRAPKLRSRSRRHTSSDVDDLNRVTLAATCEALPLCRDRGVTLLVRLVSEAICIWADSRQLEQATICLVEEASAVASLSGEGGWVLVETIRTGLRAELRMTSCGCRKNQEITESVRAARQVVEAHGGSLEVTEDGGQTTLSTMLPLSEPGMGDLEERIDAPGNLPISRPPKLGPVPLKLGPLGPRPWLVT